MTMQDTLLKLNNSNTYFRDFRAKMEGTLDEISMKQSEFITWAADWLGASVDKSAVGSSVGISIIKSFKSLSDLYVKSKVLTPVEKGILELCINKNLKYNWDIIGKTFNSLCAFYSKTIKSFESLNCKDINKINKSFKAQLSVLENDLDPIALNLFLDYFDIQKFSGLSNNYLGASDDACGHCYRGSSYRSTGC